MSLPTFKNALISIPRPHVLLVTMNRPANLNAFDVGLHDDMSAIWDLYEKDDNLWCAVLTGAGRAFSAGNDLVEMSTKPPHLTKKKGNNGFGGLTDRTSLNKPIIAAVNGIAMGGGMETAIACDIIIASDQARFALPEVKVGLSAMAGGTANLHRLLGYHNAMALILTGRQFTAQEAKEYRLVQEVVPHSKLVERALQIAEEITANSPDGVRASKAQARRGREVGWVQANLDAMKLPETVAMATGENAKEGPLAFAQKRKPAWKPLNKLPKL
ncbi:short chain enoyl-CoA hydratase [Gonapodya prolifera JEL478]|uniref:Short chain enoyl-CoA hydratase n=1 Tax=Gonapodya prolifera (strain JEL478) TaxID=1344416 RepID=A0A139AYS9_GONPJ|nr:short chain enoyl-CoA hydratase [Gonapodya prolifera JEL478]|eukprot:KXS21879.1 short chain enoyl-CoA hydratase [Gonapodya prolifera JEL478]